MQFAKLSRVLFVFVMSALAFPRQGGAQQPVDLGRPPAAPKDVSGLPGGVRKYDVTAGFSVNNFSREEMRSFYNGVYAASSGVPINSTSVVSNCVPGANSIAYMDAVARRINWFRAAAGLPASISLDSGESADDQAAALMISANGTLTHFPPPTWTCFTTNGANASSNSNIAIGNAGADAITAYIWDFGANNTEVGHRRWIFYPQTQIMGTGDIPAQGSFEAANATWVFDANFFGPRPATATPYVAWPPPGFIPYPLAYPQWSFSLSNADLSGATVTMQSNGVNVVISNQPYQTGFGENTIVWVPDNLDATSLGTVFPFSGTDTVYSIVVTNIIADLSTTGFAYTVTLFDPGVPGADYIPAAISGPAKPGIGFPNNYTCAPPNNPHVTGYQWVAAQSSSGSFFDGAENGASNFTVAISPGYSVTANGPAASGRFSFHLAMPAAEVPGDQILQLNRVLLPATNTLLSFASLLGYASINQIAEVQVSSNGGLSWQNIFSQAGTNGGPNNLVFSNRSLSLSNYAGQSVLLCFNFHFVPNANGSYSLYDVLTNPPEGWFIDNITITNTLQLTNFSTNATASPAFVFTPAAGGGWILEAEPVIFNQFPIGFGPLAQLTASPAIFMGQPVVTGGQVQLSFSVSTGVASTFKLLQANQVPSVWTTNASAVLTTNVQGASYRFTTPAGPAARFYRIQSP
jgi:hypothetical protein